MRIEVHIPVKKKVLAGGRSVQVARKGERWSQRTLGTYAKDKGVYVIHHAGEVKYVGKTDGPTMSFGVRLRREFQEGAAQGKHIYPKLSKLKGPSEIKVYFFPAEKTRKLVTASRTSVSDNQRFAILEVCLQQAYEPQFSVKS